MRTLIFRTDRLGDFYITIPYIRCLTKNLGKKNIDILVNEHIYPHIRKKKFLYNNLFSLPRENLLKKIYLLNKLKKKNYDQIVIFDGKDRSLIFANLLNVDKIYLRFPLKKKNFITKFFFKKKYKVFYDNQLVPIQILFNKILSSMNLNKKNIDDKILPYKNPNKISFLKKEKIAKKSYIHLHVDEKWFSKLYIKNYTDISPNVHDFFKFIKKIIEIKKKNIIITSGTIELPFINKMLNNYFYLHKKKYSLLKIGNFKIILLSKLTIDNLEIISMNSDTLITCHGPLLQISGTFGVNIIDIIEKSQKKWYYRHTSHIKKYRKVYRDRFANLSKKIILNI